MPFRCSRWNIFRLNQGDLDRAIADFNRAIDLDPQCAEAYDSRGSAYRSEDGFDRAITDFDQAMAPNPQFAEAFYIRGATYYITQGRDRALLDFMKAMDLRLEPEYAQEVEELIEELEG